MDSSEFDDVPGGSSTKFSKRPVDMASMTQKVFDLPVIREGIKVAMGGPQRQPFGYHRASLG